MSENQHGVLPGGDSEVTRHLEGVMPVLLNVARKMHSERDVDRLLRYVPQVVTEMTDSERCTIFLIDREKNELWSRVATDVEGEIRLQVGVGIVGHVAETGQVLNIDDPYSDDRFNREIDQVTGFTTRNLLSVPLKNFTGEVVGVCQLLNKRSGPFGKEDEDLLELLGSQAAVALEGARLNRENQTAIRELTATQERLQEQMLRMQVLYEIEQGINRSEDFEDALSSLITKTAQALRAEGGSILLLEENSSQMYFKYTYGEASEDLKSLSIGATEGVAGSVLRSGQAEIVNDVSRDPRFSSKISDELSLEVHNLMAAPLSAGGKTLGVMELVNRADGDFLEEDRETFQFIAEQASATLERKRLTEESQKAQRLASVGDMASRIIHDFKNPMTVIRGIIQLIEQGELPPEKKSEYARMMLSEIDRCVEMTQDILDFARGGIQYNLTPTPVDPFMSGLIPLVERDCDKHKVELEVETTPGLVMRSDSGRLKRVFFNISRNALEAMHQEGGKLTIVVRDVDGGVEFSFTDTGPGIPEEIRARLFQPFVTSGKRHGTGLGLATSRSIVEGHQGRLTVDDSYTGGTRFIAWIPAA